MHNIIKSRVLEREDKEKYLELRDYTDDIQEAYIKELEDSAKGRKIP